MGSLHKHVAMSEAGHAACALLGYTSSQAHLLAELRHLDLFNGHIARFMDTYELRETISRVERSMRPGSYVSIKRAMCPLNRYPRPHVEQNPFTPIGRDLQPFSDNCMALPQKFVP